MGRTLFFLSRTSPTRRILLQAEETHGIGIKDPPFLFLGQKFHVLDSLNGLTAAARRRDRPPKVVCYRS